MQATAKLSIILSVHQTYEYAGGIIDNIKNQIIKNWECIVVVRGGADGCVNEVLRGLSDDDRFTLINTEHEEIGNAYNMGIKQASGRYVAFITPDCKFDESYFEILYNSAFRNKADLAIGNLKQLAHPTKQLQTTDPEVIARLSLTDKIFKKKTITDNDIFFDSTPYGCELAFILRFLIKAKSIYGSRDALIESEGLPICEKDLPCIYKDERALLEFKATLSKLIDEIDSEFKNRKSGVEKGSAAERELINNYESFKSKLLCQIAKEVYVDDIYRYFWRAEKDILDIADQELKELKSQAFPHDWSDMVMEESRDLAFDNDELLDRKSIKENPKVTFAISGIDDQKTLNNIIEGIYSQKSPQFEVFTESGLHELVDQKWTEKSNFRSADSQSENFKKLAYENCKSEYIWFIDKAIYFSSSIVQDMLSCIEDYRGVLFASAPISRIAESKLEDVRSNYAAFIPEFNMQKMRTSYNQLDYLWINKLFSIAKLNAMQDPFGQSDRETLKRFYSYTRFHKEPDLRIVCNYTNEEVLKNVSSGLVKLSWEGKLRKNEKWDEKAEARMNYKATARTIYRSTRSKLIRYFTLKVLYPGVYKINSIRPIDPRKVIFVQPSKLEIDGNLLQVMQAVESLGGYKTIPMLLGRKFVRVREQIKRETHFVKEMATARYVFVAEAIGVVGGFKKRKGTTMVQLWHGCGAFKQFGYSTAEYIFGGDTKEKYAYPGYSNADLVTVSSPEVIWAYQEAMGYEGTDVVQATGVSRTDVFYDEAFLNEAHERIRQLTPKSAGRKILLYAPTFRGRVKKAKGPDRLDIRAMKEALGEEYYLLVKHHPIVRVPPTIPEDCADFAQDVSGTANIEDLICCADICISDYSSLVFEYSLFERPMLFFAYDIEDYDEWRGFYYDYDELTPGPVLYTTEEIIDYIKNVDTKFDKEQVARFRNKFMSACDGHATEKILRSIGFEI